jgi:hypothetical protein
VWRDGRGYDVREWRQEEDVDGVGCQSGELSVPATAQRTERSGQKQHGKCGPRCRCVFLKDNFCFYFCLYRGGNNHSPTRQMRVEFGIGECFFLLSVSLFSLLIESYSSPIPKYKHTHDTMIYLLLWHTHSHDGLFFVQDYRRSAHCTNAQQRHDFGEFFSDLVNKNFELLASVASALKILIPPLVFSRCRGSKQARANIFGFRGIERTAVKRIVIPQNCLILFH